MKKKVLSIVAFALTILAVSVIGLNAAPRFQKMMAISENNDKGLYSNPQGTKFCCKPLETYNCGAADCVK